MAMQNGIDGSKDFDASVNALNANTEDFLQRLHLYMVKRQETNLKTCGQNISDSSWTM